MKKPKPAPLTIKSIKFEAAQVKFIEKTAEAQGHYNFSEVVKRLVNREMRIH